jgi:uncharacterized membrane protein
LCAAIAYTILQRCIIAFEGADSVLATAVGRDLKGRVSPVLYVAAIPLAFVRPWISYTLFVVVAMLWLVPDRRIEHRLNEASSTR